MKKYIIILLISLCSCSSTKTINVDNEIAKAKQTKTDMENLPIIILFCVSVYFGAKFLTDDFK